MAYDAPPPITAADLVAKMHAIVKARKPLLGDILFHCQPSLLVDGYDNYNGGTYTWKLLLEVDPSVYPADRSERDTRQKELIGEGQFFNEISENHSLGAVTLIPGTPGQNHSLVSDREAEEIWGDGVFRLFVSHHSSHRDFANQFSRKIADFGVRAFVAHDDIAPTEEWQTTIEKALSTAHSLAALLTPDFHDSKWTDQEVGWALGRDILVVPVCLGAVPYGLIGKYQGSPSRENINAAWHASQVTRLLLKNQKTRPMMRPALVDAFVRSESFDQAKTLSHMVVELEDLTNEEISRIQKATENNWQISQAHGVPERIHRKFGPYDAKADTSLLDQIPF